MPESNSKRLLFPMAIERHVSPVYKRPCTCILSELYVTVEERMEENTDRERERESKRE